MEDTIERTPVNTASKADLLRRLAYIDGHLQGVRRMVEDDKYCVDVLKQTYAVRRAIEKLEAMILENHLQGCVVEGIKEGRENAVIGELIDLYELAGR
jgi:DNA-binding FrmR family transcriptional regulator